MLALIIPAHNEEQLIGDCLTAIQENAEGQFSEIIVVNNASTDKTTQIAESYPYVKVVHEPNKGLPNARQKGYEESTAEIVCYVDADTRMPKGWAERVRHEFTNNVRSVSLSGPPRYFDATPVQRFLLSASWWVSAPLVYRVVGYMVYGGHFAVRRDALDAIGGFNRSITFYGEDTHLARELSRVGATVFDMDFHIYASARRFLAEGIFMTNLRYSLNYLWPVLFNRPFHTSHSDIRGPSQKGISNFRAVFAAALFTLFGVYGFLHAAHGWLRLEETLFYALLVFNTFFSVRFFSKILPSSLRQAFIDLILVGVYASLALSLGTSLLFPLWAAALFLAATVKYGVEIQSSRYKVTLRRKMTVDLLGALLAIVTLGISAAGVDILGEWISLALFTAANVYILVLKPLYVIAAADSDNLPR